MQPISRIVRKFLTDNQSIADCARRGLINYSALARDICSEHGIRKVDAVLMACRRQVRRMPRRTGRDDAIRQLVRKAKVSLQTKMAVVIIEKPRSFERIFDLQELVRKEGGVFTLVEGDEVVTFVLSDDWLSEIRTAFKGKILRVSEELVQLNMVFSRKIETTPGVIAFVYRLLAEHGINILEEMSCWTDLMIMIEEKDMSVVTTALRAI